MGALERFHGTDLGQRQSQDAGHHDRLALPLGRALSPPIDQAPALAQERRRVLEHHGRRPQRPGQDEVALPGEIGPLLDPRADRARVDDPRGLGEPLDEPAFTPLALHEVHLAVLERNCQRQAGKARSRAEVGDHAGPAPVREVLELQRHQRISHVEVDGVLDAAYRRRRVLGVRQRREQRCEALPRRLVEPEPGADRTEALMRHSARRNPDNR